MEMEGRLVEEKLLVSALECPVCLSLPHSLPVYTCRVGHHVCGCCWRSLSGKCPVCLTDYSRPPTRSFLAESLLELVERPCRGEDLGCKVRCLGSTNLKEHEAQCNYIEEQEQCKKCKCFLNSDHCQRCETRRRVAPLRAAWVHPYFLGFSLGLFLLLVQHYWMGTVHWSHWLGLLVRPLQKPDCPTVALYWQWPDTFLPGSMEAAVWRPTEDNSGTFTLQWDRTTQAYRHANQTRYGVTRAASPVKAALTWKLVLPQELKVCGVQLFTSNNNDSNKNGLQMINSNIVELDHLDGILLRDWWREELWKTEELLVVAILTDQCHLDNLLWRVTTAIAGNCSKPVKQRLHWSSVLYGFF